MTSRGVIAVRAHSSAPNTFVRKASYSTFGSAAKLRRGISEDCLVVAGTNVDQKRTAAATTALSGAVGIVIGAMGAEEVSAAEGAACAAVVAAVATAPLVVVLTAVGAAVAACAVQCSSSCTGAGQQLELQCSTAAGSRRTHVIFHTRQ